VEQTVGALCSLWQFRQTPMVVTLVASDMRSICATFPWHIWHFIPASRCLRCVQVTPGRTVYTRTHGIGWRDFEKEANFWIAGLLVAIVAWQDMQVLVAGKVISAPGAGLVWHVEQGKSRARWVLWL